MWVKARFAGRIPTSSTATAASATSARQSHAGDDHAILAARDALYAQARERNPARWSRDTRDWTPVGAVTLNPEREAAVAMAHRAEGI